MKNLIICLFAALSLAASTKEWMIDLDAGKQVARKENKFILLNFSGSDWCLPCMRLHKDVFESSVFADYADNLVLVNADFPRQKKNKLSPEQEKRNDALAGQYNQEGRFPLTLLLDADGKEIRRWTGEVGNPATFVDEIRHASRPGK